MGLSIRIPDALDLTAYRLAVGDTTAMITKISGTQAAMEQYSAALNDYTADLLALADAVDVARLETIQVANSVNLPVASSAPGLWLQAQQDGSYALRGITHTDIAGLDAHYLQKSGGNVAGNLAVSGWLSVGGHQALTRAGGSLTGPLAADAGLSVGGYQVVTRGALVDGLVRWSSSQQRLVSAVVTWDDVQDKPPVTWDDVQGKLDFDLSALVSTGSAITRNQDGYIASITDHVGDHERTQTLNYSNGQLTSVIVDYNNTSQTYTINRDAAGRVSGVAAL